MFPPLFGPPRSCSGKDFTAGRDADAGLERSRHMRLVGKSGVGGHAHRGVAAKQELSCQADAPVDEESVRRQADFLLEGADQMRARQSGNPRQRRQIDIFGDMRRQIVPRPADGPPFAGRLFRDASRAWRARIRSSTPSIASSACNAAWVSSSARCAWVNAALSSGSCTTGEGKVRVPRGSRPGNVGGEIGEQRRRGVDHAIFVAAPSRDCRHGRCRD